MRYIGNRIIIMEKEAHFRPFEKLSYKEALLRLSEGIPVKLPEWDGFWFPVKDKIFVFTKDNKILDTPDHDTYGQRNDWTCAISYEIYIRLIKAIRVRIDSILKHIKSDVSNTRESSLAYTSVQLGFMYLGLYLGDLGAENPYPQSSNPESPVIEKHADQADADTDYFAINSQHYNETAKVKGLRGTLQDHIDLISAIGRAAGTQRYTWAMASDKLVEGKLWLGQQLNNIRMAQEEQPQIEERSSYHIGQVSLSYASGGMEEAVNTILGSGSLNTNAISDGYHTFGELYDHRITLYIALCRILKQTNARYIWRSKYHSDGTLAFGGGWFVLGIDYAPGEQITYHLPEELWDKTDFAQTLSCAPEFDGHTSEEVLQRLSKLDY